MSLVMPHLSATPSFYQCQDLSASLVTPDQAGAFYHLIQEQAAQHTSAIEAPEYEVSLVNTLYQTAIEEGGINAFLVMSGETPLAAVTYTKCQTERGAGLYLEDIVTTKAARGRGVGHFAMSVLSQITQAHGHDYLIWECARDNVVANRFYTNLGAAVCGDRHTYRFEGQAQGQWPAQVSPYHECRPMEGRDVPAAAQLMRQSLSAGLPHLEAWLDQEVQKNDDSVFMVCCGRDDRQVNGFAYGYRSYSTFRMVNGLHVNGMFAQSHTLLAFRAMCGALSNHQIERNWTGHTDITLQAGQENMLSGLTLRGYAPLSYGDSQMAVRGFDQRVLAHVASLCPVENISDLMTRRARRPVPSGRIARSMHYQPSV